MRKCVENAAGFLPGNSRNSTNIGSPKREIVVRRREAILRFATVVVAVVSAVGLGVASEKSDVLGIEKTANFHQSKSLVFLVIAEGTLAGYSLLQGIRCVSSIYMGSFLLSKKVAWMIFSCDQVMSYVTIAAAASAAESAILAIKGNTELQWISLCGFFKKYCWQMGSAIVIGGVSGVAMMVVSGISAYNLFRLYGTKSKIPRPIINRN